MRRRSLARAGFAGMALGGAHLRCGSGGIDLNIVVRPGGPAVNGYGIIHHPGVDVTGHHHDGIISGGGRQVGVVVEFFHVVIEQVVFFQRFPVGKRIIGPVNRPVIIAGYGRGC